MTPAILSLNLRVNADDNADDANDSLASNVENTQETEPAPKPVQETQPVQKTQVQETKPVPKPAPKPAPKPQQTKPKVSNAELSASVEKISTGQYKDNTVSIRRVLRQPVVDAVQKISDEAHVHLNYKDVVTFALLKFLGKTPQDYANNSEQLASAFAQYHDKKVKSSDYRVMKRTEQLPEVLTVCNAILRAVLLRIGIANYNMFGNGGHVENKGTNIEDYANLPLNNDQLNSFIDAVMDAQKEHDKDENRKRNQQFSK